MRPSIHYIKASKRGISTPLISAVLRAVAPFQTSCALPASPFFKRMIRAAGFEPAPLALSPFRNRSSTRIIQPVFKRSEDAYPLCLSMKTGAVGVSPRQARLLPIPERSAWYYRAISTTFWHFEGSACIPVAFALRRDTADANMLQLLPRKCTSLWWWCKGKMLLSQIVGHTRRISTLLVKSLSTVHSLVNNPYRFSLVFQTIEPLSFTNPATAWCSSCFVHLCPMTFFQVSPLRMIDIIAIIHNTHAHPCCIIFQTGL